MGLHIGATVSFQDPKQAYEIMGCGFGSVCFCVCVSVCVCKICSILKLDFKLLFLFLKKAGVTHSYVCLLILTLSQAMVSDCAAAAARHVHFKLL